MTRTRQPAPVSAPAAARVLARCDELAAVTAVPGRTDRFHLTPEHARANALVAGWMSQAGLRAWQDEAGNVCGRREGPRPESPALLLGSHLDTVPDAGRYDGPLGVLLAVEVADRLRDVPLPFALEVVGFGDEEGARFGTALLGSSALAGTWDDAWCNLVDPDGVSLAQAARDFGLDPARIGAAARRPEALVGYLEAHIEQGPLLEAADRPLGEVTAIAGARRFLVVLQGEARHAGGTPYDRRRDALLGASSVALAVERIGRARDVVATVGRLEVEPGAVNVVPGRATLSVDVRAQTDEQRDAAWDAVLAELDAVCRARGLGRRVVELHAAPAVPCAPWLRQAVRDGIAATGQGDVPALPSWAGHDAMAVAAVTDVGMVFVRCADGISHAPQEAVDPGDVARAAEAFEAVVRDVARRWAGGGSPASRGVHGSETGAA